MVDFGNRLRELRLSFGLSESELAKKMHVTKAAISSYELRTRNPSAEIVVQLSKAFHVTSDYLLGLDNRLFVEVTDLSNEDLNYVNATLEMLRSKNKNN